jgi:hypothetical protein
MMDMKILSILGLAVAALITLMAVRENLVLQEVQTLKTELLVQLRQDIQKKNDAEELKNLENSSKLFQTYVQPVASKAQSLLWPALRKKNLETWSVNLFQQLEVELDLRRIELAHELNREIDMILAENSAGDDRLLKILEVSQRLPDADERIKLIQNELNSMQAALSESDRQRLSEIRGIGIEGLRKLRSFLAKNTDETTMVSYLSSRAFYGEVIEPVSEQILSLHQAELRKLTWNEFSMQLLRTLDRQNQRLAKIRQDREEKSKNNALADLLKLRFEEELQKEMLEAGSPVETELN